MANLIRSALSGRWTQEFLRSFNIRVVDATVPAFFACTKLPPPSVSPTILNNLYAPRGHLSTANRHFFMYLEDAEQSSEKSAVTDFAAFLLGMLDYDDEGRFVRRRREISFCMGGRRVRTKPEVSVMSNELDCLLVQENECQQSSDDPEPPLIAAAISAYYQNNVRHTRVGLPALPIIPMPAITMVGAAPIFYRIPVSRQLLEALATLTYPKEETVVLKFVPPVANMETYINEGMRPLANRYIVMQCFKAFKATMVSTFQR